MQAFSKKTIISVPLYGRIFKYLQLYFSIFSDSCVDVDLPFNGWQSAVGSCPNCRNELRVTLAPIPGKRPPHGPHSPVILSRNNRFEPTYLPNSHLYPPPRTTLLPTAYNNELQRLADTLNALRLSGWYYGNLDLQVSIIQIIFKYNI